jgi:4-amino-4-deoxy-L-arabinose transferase-like glycosyltransferase
MATEPRVAPPRRRELQALAAVTAAFVAVLCMWAAITPMFRAPDELQHVNSSVRAALGQGYPAPGDARIYDGLLQLYSTNDAAVAASERESMGDVLGAGTPLSGAVDQMTQHPPTYYLLTGAILAAADFQSLRWDASVMLLRALDILLLAPLPVLVWAVARRATRSPRASITAAAALLLVPQLASTGSAATNDAPVVTGGALLVLLATRIITGDRRWVVLLGAGALLGGLLLVKGTMFPAIPFLALAVLFGRGAVSTARRLVQLCAVGGLVAAISGWWWVRNLVLYGAIQPNGLASARPPVPWEADPYGLIKAPNIEAFSGRFWDGLTQNFWGGFGRNEFPIVAVVVDVLTVGCLLLCAIFAYRRGASRREALILSSFPLVALAVLASTSWATYVDTQVALGMQARYLFPSIAALIAVAAIAGLHAVGTERARELVGLLVPLGGAVMAVYALSVTYRGAYEYNEFRVSLPGLRILFLTSPVGRLGILVLGAVLVAALVLAVLAVRRATRAAALLDPAPPGSGA